MEQDMAMMISELIGQMAQLELMVKYGVKPTPEMLEEMHKRYDGDKRMYIEAQTAVNTQRDIDMQQVKKPVVQKQEQIKPQPKSTPKPQPIQKPIVKELAEKPHKKWSLFELFRKQKPDDGMLIRRYTVNS